jgi:hypothetical protein
MNKTTEALKLAEEALDLAQGSHGVMLMSNPPHDAWAYRGVEHRINKALAAIREARGEQKISDKQMCLARESAIKEALKLADEIDAEFYQGRISNHNGRKAAQMIRLLVDSPVQPVKQEPVAWAEYNPKGARSNLYFEFGAGLCEEDIKNGWRLEPLYAAPVDAKDIRAEALEEAAIAGGAAAMAGLDFIEVAAAIRGLK